MIYVSGHWLCHGLKCLWAYISNVFKINCIIKGISNIWREKKKWLDWEVRPQFFCAYRGQKAASPWSGLFWCGSTPKLTSVKGGEKPWEFCFLCYPVALILCVFFAFLARKKQLLPILITRTMQISVVFWGSACAHICVFVGGCIR